MAREPGQGLLTGFLKEHYLPRLDRIDALPFTTIAVIHGHCLGGGLNWRRCRAHAVGVRDGRRASWCWPCARRRDGSARRPMARSATPWRDFGLTRPRSARDRLYRALVLRALREPEVA
jgi:hypothetical protein